LKLIVWQMNCRPTATDFELATSTIGRCLRDLTFARVAVAVGTTDLGGTLVHRV
jgi:hypothetical protein